MTRISIAILSALTVTGLAMAQTPADGPAPDQAQPQYPPAGQYPQPQYGQYPQSPYPQYPPAGQYPQQPQYPAYPPQQANYPAPPPLPATLTIKPGTYVTVRINQWLSSDRNQAGDAFAATLDQPLIVDGIVVAQRGQTVGGRVTEAQKAGHVTGTSRLGLELIDLTLADGQVVQTKTSMLTRNGTTSVGRDVAATAGTTGLGAAAGAIAGGGTGAAIGAGAGAFVGLAGVLLTRGNPTVVYPESVMTFRIESPIDVSTEHAPQAFRYADQMDYGRPPAGPAQPAPAGYGYPPAVVARPYPYYPYAYPYGYPYYGPSIGVYVGPGFYYRGGFWRR
ncbi:MAG TPA: hypothetical protein VEF06_00940 [Bryobacteraceae bacterium]|nr:hypothetical protein [Bryobacteraceae bacterium]